MGDQPGPYGQKMRSHAARDSFFIFAKRSYAARRSFFWTKLRSHAGGVRFSSDRPHLVDLDWSVWTGLSGPVCLDPVCLDPVCLDSVCLDPVCLDLSNLFSRALLPTTRLEAHPPHSYPHLRGVIYVYTRTRMHAQVRVHVAYFVTPGCQHTGWSLI